MLLSSSSVADGRHGIVRVDRVPLACKLVDLPCMIESLKTVDKKTFYKTADVCQVKHPLQQLLYVIIVKPGVSFNTFSHRQLRSMHLKQTSQLIISKVVMLKKIYTFIVFRF